jgi:hypothetical protein
MMVLLANLEATWPSLDYSGIGREEADEAISKTYVADISDQHPA